MTRQKVMRPKMMVAGKSNYSVYPDLRPNLADMSQNLFAFLTRDPCAFDSPATNTWDVPERRLCRALLWDAVDIVTVRKKGRDKAEAREEAKLWFLGELPDTVLTFAYCCAVLNLDEAYFLRQLRARCDLESKSRRAA